MAFKPELNRNLCRGCEGCIELCSASVLEMRRGKAAVANEAACVGCEACAGVCGEKAIVIRDLRVRLSPTCESLLRDIL